MFGRQLTWSVKACRRERGKTLHRLVSLSVCRTPTNTIFVRTIGNLTAKFQLARVGEEASPGTRHQYETPISSGTLPPCNIMPQPPQFWLPPSHHISTSSHCSGQPHDPANSTKILRGTTVFIPDALYARMPPNPVLITHRQQVQMTSSPK